MSASDTPSPSRRRLPFIIIGLAATIVAAVILFQAHTMLRGGSLKSEDIFYVFGYGDAIAKGDNPYAQIVGKGMRFNRKYPTYFPAMPLAVALQQKIRPTTFSAWVAGYRWVSLFFHLAAGVIFFVVGYRRYGPVFAILLSSFWWFNRWTLLILRIAHIDVIALFFLILAFYLLRHRRNWAFFVFGLSLAVKQIGIFLIPLLLIWAFRHSEKDRLKKSAVALGLMLLVPFVLSLPFLFWHAEGYLRSIFFSATRMGGGHFGQAASLSHLFQWHGFAGRLIMLGLMALTYYCYWRRTLSLAVAGLLVMCAFLHFNAVLFVQYLVWALPFILMLPTLDTVTVIETSEPSKETL